ncbi:peptidoglycan bridge formation glycyltransferase FemA/FemB family protein [soil metagenome]
MMYAKAESPSGTGESPEAWDAALQSTGGHLLQSWRWGEFKALHGWEPERISSADGAAMAQVLFRRKGPVSVGYVPRGPAWGKSATNLHVLIEAIDEAARRRRALYTIFELERDLPGSPTSDADGWIPGPEHIQPGRTVKIALEGDDEMLKRMHQKTRYSVRLAMRKGVEIEQHEGLDEQALGTFYRLLRETSERNEFGIHDEAYYRDFLRIFGDHALLEVARVNGRPAAGLIAASFGDEAIYMYGGSSAEIRAHGAAFLLQFDAMRWARDKGLARYDLWGIPMHDPETPKESQDAVPATKGDDWRGLHRFKTGFGGAIVDYPAMLERRYHRFATRLAQRMARALG